MPSIPALPATNAPSFAERLSSDTPISPAAAPTPAPSERTMSPQLERTLALTRKAAALGSHPYHHHHHRGGRRPITPPQQQGRNRMMMGELERPLAPPLPLVLRPPLRKKKSFSGRRVSRWLFPAGESEGGAGVGGSVTNAPRPVRGGEGFYQSVSSSSSYSSSEEGEGGGEKGEGESGWETESGGTTPRGVGTAGMGSCKGEEAGGEGRRGPGQRGSVGVAF